MLLIDLPATGLMLIRGGAEDLVHCDIGDTPCQPAAAELGRPVAGGKWNGNKSNSHLLQP